jgi:ADP-ribose pyrophosphatase YjhB (NUDIX family)
MDKREPYYSDKPLVTVGGLIVAPDGDVLLVQSHKWSDRFTVPGGKVEYGESREEAFKREVKEEAGLEVVDVHFLMVVDCMNSLEFWKKGAHFVMNDYWARLADGQTKDDVVLNDEAQRYVWTPPHEAFKFPLTRETIVLVNGYLNDVKQTRM